MAASFSPERAAQIRALFDEAVELDAEARVAYLDQACGDDPTLRRKVEGLLSAFDARDSDIRHALGQLPLAPGPGAGARWDKLAALLEEAEALPPEQRGGSKQSGPDRLIGQRISHYQILEKLGSGGMGVVYKARDPRLRRTVALKFLPPDLTRDPDARERFVREAQAASALDHPNICTIYEIDETEPAPGEPGSGQTFIAMAYYQGETLKKKIARGPLPVEDALDYARQVARGLSKAHAQGIVHRDIKPANVVVTDEGVAKIVDFGLAKMAGTELTKTGTTMGTVAYMSPEQAEGETVDGRTDLWSLGVVLYEMLTGQRPFRGEHEQSVIHAILTKEPEPITALRPEVSAALAQVVQQMLRKDPALRYRQIEEVLTVLRMLSEGRAAEIVVEQPASATAPFPFKEHEEEPAEAVAPLFVARQDELEHLDAWLLAALAGQGRVVFVTGEAGTGKTALIQEFARRALGAHPHLIVASGYCNAHTGLGDPYLPFREVLSLLTGDIEAQWAAGAITRDHAERLWRLLPLSAQALVDAGPDLADTFVAGAPLVTRAVASVPGRPGWLGRLKQLVERKAALPPDASLQQYDLFEQYTKVLHRLARQHPLLLMLEDLHWADVGSASLLFHLGRRIEGARMLIVGTYRPAEVALGRGEERHPLEPVVHELRRAFGDIDVEVGKAGARPFTEALIDAKPNRLGAAFREALFRQAGGHSLFTIELLRGMQEQGMIRQDEQGRWVETPTLAWERLPARIVGVIGERLGRLSEPLRKVLAVACVEGEVFTAEVVARVQQADEREMVRLLSSELDRRHRLVSVQSVEQVGGRRLSRYRFRHILFQKYLYRGLDEVERAYLHEDVAAVLEELYGEQAEAIAAPLARHFEEAGLVAKALVYLSQAAEQAARVSAHGEAIGHFRQALLLLERLAERPERARQEVSLQLGLAVSLQATRGMGASELEGIYARARALAEQTGDTAQRVRALLSSNGFYGVRAEHRKALDLAEQLVSLTEGAGDAVLVALARWARAYTLHFLGAYERALEDAEHVIGFYDAEQHGTLAFVYGRDPRVSSRVWAGGALWFLGYLEQALQRGREALILAEKLNHPHALAQGLHLVGAFHFYRRDFQQVEEHARALLRLSKEKGFLWHQSMATILLGKVQTEQGQLEEGLAQMQAGLAAMQATGGRILHTLYHAHLAEAYGKAGRAEEGLQVLAETLEAMEKTEERNYEAELHRLKGELLLMQGAVASEAEACFQQALEVARRQRAKMLELWAVMSLSRLWQRQGKKEQAHQSLEEIYTWFTEGFATKELVEAKTLLEELS